MAPVRVAQTAAGGGVAKKVSRKRATRREPSDSWELLHRQGMDAHADDDDEIMNGHDDLQIAAIDGPTDIDEAVNPLREMAERVGKEVETFAETVDKFLNEELPTASSRFDAVYDLVLDFQSIAENKVAELKQLHDKETRDQLKQEWSAQSHIPAASTTFTPFTSAGASLGPRKAEQVKQLRRWQQEADIWNLFKIMLDLHPFDEEARARQGENNDRLVSQGEPHRYTEEGTLWQRFLMEDPVANERHKIKTWLETTADHQQTDIQDIVEELETKAGRGKGLWSAGWMNTREQIKKEKRLRTWPNAADSPLPQIRRSDNNEMLATQLDPDAPARQQRTLEKPDAYFERAIWIPCWEMLRRGASPEDIVHWCRERKEDWRAISMGQLFDNTQPEVSGATWRHVCQLASQNAGANDYEAAVFGLLGGNVKAMQKVCRTIDDNLYAHYSATLLRQFEQYVLRVCPEQATPWPWRHSIVDSTLHDPEQAAQAITDLILRLRTDFATKQESAQPMKIIQSYLLADEVGSLIHTVGTAIAATASLQGPEDMIFLGDRRAQQNGVLSEAEVALDPQTLRIAAHMSIVHRTLSPNFLEGDELMEDENVLVAYIQALRTAGKRDLIPLYASKLQRARYIVVLGRTLQDITDADEQSRVLGLLQEYDMDVLSILTEQLRWVIDHQLPDQIVPRPLRILESTVEQKLHPEQRIIVDFLPDEVTPGDEALVRCLQWYQMSEGSWKVTFEALSFALRRCLVTGRFACARMIVQHFPYEEVSLRKSYEAMGRSVNLMEPTASTPYEDDDRMRWDIMRRQSRVYYELEQLITAVEALSTWRVEEDKYIGKAQKPASVPNVLKRAKEHVSNTMAPILKGILQNAVDEKEAAELAFIRMAYLPEIIIAYNTVLHAAGNLITRDCLLESMDLSVAIAKDGSDTANDEADGQGNGLADCFVRAGRMRELVNGFALTSKVMLILKAEGKVWKQRKDRVGKDLGIWEIGNAGRDGGRDEE